MKKYISKTAILLTLLGTSTLLQSCYDLNVYPQDKLVQENFWRDEADAKMVMMGVYAAMKHEKVFGEQFMTDCMSDIATGFDFYSFNQTVEGRATGRTEYITDKFQSTYHGVMRANNLIANVDKVPMSEEKKQLYTAEAKFMRALFYFHLSDFFGGVPLYDETTNITEEFMTMTKSRSTLDETRAFILKDLDAAVELLPVSWPVSDKGRATKGAAYALRGKVKLFAKNYSGAKSDFDEIVNDPNKKGYGYALYPEYADLFKRGADGNLQEMIFYISNLGGAGNNYGMPLARYLGTRSCMGQGWNNSMVSQTLFDMYELKDGTPFNWDEYYPGYSHPDTAISNPVKRKAYISTMGNSNAVVATWADTAKLRLTYRARDPRLEQSCILPYTYYNGWYNNAVKNCIYLIANRPGAASFAPHEQYGFIRKQATGYSDNCPYWRKFVPEGNQNGEMTNVVFTPVNFPLIRYADVLLMLAECCNELGDQAKAVEYINRVRARPSTSMPPRAVGSKEQVFKYLMHERAVELACEGHRYSDLKRWKLAKEMLNGKEERGLAGQRLYTRVFNDRDYLWPMPDVEYDRNPNLGANNPGW